MRKAAGELELVSYPFDCRMIGFYPGAVHLIVGALGPMRFSGSAAGMLSASFIHGLP